MTANLCRVWYGRTVIGPKQAFAGVLVWAEDDDEPSYASPGQTTPQSKCDATWHMPSTPSGSPAAPSYMRH